MRAFVKVNNGTFPNLNFYLAWEALTFMGYSVTLFEEKDIDNLDISVNTPVFAGVTIFKKIVDKLGINYPPFDCYPEVLKPYYGRTLTRSTLGEERRKFNIEPKPVFVKPVLPKQFVGHVWNSIINLIPIANIPDEAEVWVCEPIKIDSEFRVYVHDGEILGVKHYYGDWDRVPNKGEIERVIKNYKPCPIAYGIDFATSWKQTHEWDRKRFPNCPLERPITIVMEVNDGCNLGNYGLDYIHYGEMIVSRWFEIVGSHVASEQIKDDIDRFKDNEFSQKSGLLDSIKSQDWKNLLTKSESKKARIDSMKSFANSIMADLKKEKYE